ncbi:MULTISPECIES: ZIP family metal transporter [Ectothiorhodospira]|uniref:ZIP family metal transporter n=1 Tax=Ectothiorhodospira TaxID=1051 RepID=UPI001EE89AF3|nr:MULTISPECIES: ZIP family metal transporter [Ectothiorhodospira]MCG5493320.1 ZIP family metal transporter [Ectothiorhodospira variabilis]MCG5496664.1 ZIP family metal transporter [Ectothiorhodospira variabilis]MCG5502649.1 ZIP family metal transporter [Ectothiorhodospira variabilis]MCG5505585.1 ZIP family metal transporter [Ectothiorhodospira variabilis]MCG5523379.1 ZIP family metal transporter [Ectothiorhodospira haloalkaliphila]
MNQSKVEVIQDGARVSWPGVTISLVVLVLFILMVSVTWPRIEDWVSGMGTIQIGLLASLVAGLFTAVGAIPIFFLRRIPQSVEDAMMGFGAGVMLAATAFELVLPAVEGAEAQYGAVGMAIMVLAVGMGLGGGFLLLLHRLVPHEHFMIGPQSGGDPMKIRRVYLFIFAIALHNLPEGLAVGVGFGGDVSDGMTLAVAIGLQNMPEGLVVAIALLSLGYSKATAFGVTLLTGLVQPVGGLIGATAVSVMEFLLPWGLAFAAGAMLFVISHEIIPESHRKGHEAKATLGVLIGFIALIAIDLALG